MIYRTIQDKDVPALGLGTWEHTGETCREGVAHALDLGYRHIDTAQIYGNEREVGRGIANSDVPRDDIFLVTKVWRTNAAPIDVRTSTVESLRKLQTDYVDLLLLHWPVDEIPLEDTLDAMMELQEEGMTRHIGVSNFTPSLVERAVDHVDGRSTIVTNQVEYHPYLDQSHLIAQAERHDFYLTAYSPLARGDVMGDPKLEQIGEKYDKTAAQVALRWHLQQDRVMAIPKADAAAHRAANIDVFDFALTDEEMKQIHAMTGADRRIDPGFAPTWERHKIG
jgi:diketogulonate reductase-like aldo/keto reductase